MKARTITVAQRRLLSPLFAFTRELVNDRVPGVSGYRVPGGIDFNHQLQSSDFAMGEPVYNAFKDFVANDPAFKGLMPLVAHNRSFIELQLRFNVVMAAYGRVIADRVYITGDDQQVARAVDVLPRARDLAMSATKPKIQP